MLMATWEGILAAYEVAKSAAKFAAAALTIYNFFTNTHPEDTAAKLEEIHRDIHNVAQKVMNKIDDIVVKELAGLVNGLAISLDHYVATKDTRILANLLVRTGEIRARIEQYLHDPAYRSSFITYFSLYITTASVTIVLLGEYILLVPDQEADIKD